MPSIVHAKELSIVQKSDQHIVLRWKKKPNAAAYEVRIVQPSNGNWSITKTYSNKFTIKNVQPETSYRIQVRTVHKNHISQWSRPQRIKTPIHQFTKKEMADRFGVLEGTYSGSFSNTDDDTKGDIQVEAKLDKKQQLHISINAQGFNIDTIAPVDFIAEKNNSRWYTVQKRNHSIANYFIGSMEPRYTFDMIGSFALSMYGATTPGIKEAFFYGNIHKTYMEVDYYVYFEPIGGTSGTLLLKKE